MIILIYVAFYASIFNGLPIHEDNGYYAFIAKKMSEGLVLHKDIPIHTNGLHLYIISWLFSIFGASIIVYKAFYLLFFFLLGCFVYLLLLLRFDFRVSIFWSLIVMVLIGLPNFTFDIGRNPLIPSLAMIVGSMYFLFKVNPNLLVAGFLMGVGALFRETFIVLVAGVWVYVYFNGGIDRLGRLIVGTLLAFSINGLILSYFGTWGGYLNDMFHSAAQMRYSQGFLSPERVYNNLKVFLFGFSFPPVLWYLPVIVFGSIALYFFRKDSIVKLISYLLPFLFIEALFINATTDYSIQPLILFLSLSMVFLFDKYVSFRYIAYSILFCYLIFVFSQYYKYGSYARSVVSGDLGNTDPNRLLNIIETIPHKTIAAHSQYPILFLSSVQYSYIYPFIEDTTMPLNMGSVLMDEDQRNLFEKNPPDLYIDKTDTNMMPSDAPFMKMLEKHYYLISTFYRNPNDLFYRYDERIFLSHKMLKNFPSSLLNFRLDAKSVLKKKFRVPTVVVLDESDTSRKCIGSLIMRSGQTQIEYGNGFYWNGSLSLFVSDENELELVNPSVDDMECRFRVYDIVQ